MAFPICTEPRFFEKSRSRIASLNQPTQAAIEKAQPYNRLKPGKWFMPLVWLAQLHDVDKHRFAHVSPVGSVPHEIQIGARPDTYQAFWNSGTLVDGTPILRIVLTEPDPNVYVDLKATGAVILNVKDMRPFSVYWITRRIRREVGLVCRYLAYFFPD